MFDAGIKSNKFARIKKSIRLIKEKKSIIGVCYGDIFANIDFKDELLTFKKSKAEAILVGYKENSPFGHLDIKNNLVKNFIEKPKMDKPINIGFYFFKKEIFLNIKSNYSIDLESSFLPQLATRKKIKYYLHDGFHFTVNSQKDLLNIKKNINKNKNFLSKL